MFTKSSKRRRTVRHSEKLNYPIKKVVYSIFRFLFYGVAGMFAEICLYSIIRLGKQIPIICWIFHFQWRVDDSLKLNGIWNVPLKTFYGQTSLWMLLVYGTAGFFIIESIFKKTYHRHWILRGIFYSLSIAILEFIWGFILYYIVGYRIWYYNDSMNIMHFTSLNTLPMWFISGMIVEALYRELMQDEVKNYIQNEFDSSQFYYKESM